MDKELLIQNILSTCKTAKIAPTKAFVDSGVGKDFLVNLRKTSSTSVAKVADLAAYLGVSVSDLVGDARKPEEAPNLLACWAELNEEGREALLHVAQGFVNSGIYKKSDPYKLDKKEIV